MSTSPWWNFPFFSVHRNHYVALPTVFMCHYTLTLIILLFYYHNVIMSSSVSTYTWHRAGLHFLAWSGGGVVTGAGVVTTGPHTASFLNVQNFLHNFRFCTSNFSLRRRGVTWARVILNGQKYIFFSGMCKVPMQQFLYLYYTTLPRGEMSQIDLS